MNFKAAGFSLMELMIGGVILAGIGLTGAKLIKGQKTTQAMIDHDLELDLIHSQIAAMFSENAKDCDATFRDWHGRKITGAIAEIRKCREGHPGCNARDQDALSASVYDVIFSKNDPSLTLSPRDLWRIESFGVVVPNDDSSGTTLKTNLMKMPINYIHKRFENRRVTKFVTIAMRFNQTEGFLQCIDANSSNIQNLEREICNLLVARNSSNVIIRGIWDGNKNKCTSGTALPLCPAHTVFPGLVGTGGQIQANCQRGGDIINSAGRSGMVNASACVARSTVKLSGTTGNRVMATCL